MDSFSDDREHKEATEKLEEAMKNLDNTQKELRAILNDEDVCIKNNDLFQKQKEIAAWFVDLLGKSAIVGGFMYLYRRTNDPYVYFISTIGLLSLGIYISYYVNLHIASRVILSIFPNFERIRGVHIIVTILVTVGFVQLWFHVFEHIMIVLEHAKP